MYANFEKNVIEMTKTEAAAAGKLNSDKFNELKALREMFPDFMIIVVKSHRKGDHFKGLTYLYMQEYIEKKNQKLLAEFYSLCGKDESGNRMDFAPIASYGEVKMWFLTQFPEIENQAKALETKIEETRKARMKQKAQTENIQQ